MNNYKITIKPLLYFAIFVSPIGAQAFSFGIFGVQMSPLRLSVIISIFLTLTFGISRRSLLLTKKNNLYSSLFMFFWLFYAILSVAWSIDIYYWMKSIFFVFVGVSSMVLFTNFFTTRHDILNAFKAFEFGILVQSLIGWYEVFTKDYNFIELNDINIRIYVNGALRIPIAMQGNPNNFATLMLFGFYIALICFSVSDRKPLKLFHGILAVNFIVLLFLTTSRANILAFFISIAALIFLLGYKKRYVVLLTLAPVFIIPQVTSFLHKHLIFNSLEGSDRVRIGLIKTGLSYFLDTFGIGVGSGQIEAWIMTKGTNYYVGFYTNMHNWWIEILTAYGAIVFVGYLVFYIGLIRHFYQYSKKNYSGTLENKISIPITCVLIGFILACISASSNITNEWLWLFWSVCIADQGIG